MSVHRYYDFFKISRYAWVLSGILIAVSLVSMLIPGRVNFGIDFTGGALLDLRFERAVSVGEIRDALTAIERGESVIQLAGQDGRSAFIRTKPITDAERRAIYGALEAKLGKFEVRRVETVAPVIGKELVRKAILAVILASVGMLLYITLRFEYRFAVCGIIALTHNVLIVMGVFSLFRLEVDSSFVAAILTVVGYSINDTVVVYDRIRENLKTRTKETYYHLVNRSISETLVRSINTSVTIFLAIVALYVLGGATIKNFTLALLVGVVVGTYSTTFVASSLWLVIREYQDRREQGRRETASVRAREAREARQGRQARQAGATGTAALPTGADEAPAKFAKSGAAGAAKGAKGAKGSKSAKDGKGAKGAKVAKGAKGAKGAKSAKGKKRK
jgi:preprotein translocase subunit SecF